jgi:rhamnogalacturonyl hydrolase YesR
MSRLMIGTICGGFQHSESISTWGELIPVTFRLENKNQIWDDTLMMTGSFGQRLELIPVIPLAKIGLLLNRPQYIEEGSSFIRSS